MRSALRQCGSANTYTQAPRSVQWHEDVPAPDDHESPWHMSTRSKSDTEADTHDRRVLEWDSMYDCLRKLCLAKDRWIPFIPDDIPLERRYLAPPRGEELWKRFAMDSWIPHEAGEAAEGSVQSLMIGLTLMSSFWDDIYSTIFGRLAGHRPDLNRPIVVDTETQEDWECLTTLLINRYRMFERDPYDEEEFQQYAAEVKKLAQSACELRSLLSGEEDKHSNSFIYMPVERRNQDLRFSLNYRVRSILNITDDDYDGEDEAISNKKEGKESRDVIALVLCGGLMRRPSSEYNKNGSKIASTSNTECERRAVVVTMRPEAGKSLQKVNQICD
jgi:hypothetical protein